MNNQTFSPARFAAYLTKYSTENRIKLLINYGVMFIAPIFFFSIIPLWHNPYWATIPYDPMHQTERDIYVWMFIFFTLGAGSAVYDFLKSKTQRISTFTCPASALEKFGVWFLTWIIGLTAVLFIGIFLGDAIRVWIYRSSSMVTEGSIVTYISPEYLLSLGHNMIYHQGGMDEVMIESLKELYLADTFMFYSFCFLSTSVFALGATLWPKNNIFKTIGATIGLNIVLVWLAYLGFKLLLTGDMHTTRFHLDVTTAQIYWAIAGIVFLFGLFFWTLSYFRMKEWEVIKRW